jgi:hypothetical protein
MTGIILHHFTQVSMFTRSILSSLLVLVVPPNTRRRPVPVILSMNTLVSRFLGIIYAPPGVSMEDTGMINNVVAGLRQLYQKLEYRAKIMGVARQRAGGPGHLIMMRRIIADIDVDVGSASSTV